MIITLNPAELLRQSRDANRLSDLSTFSNAMSVVMTQGATVPGVLGITYLSVPDPTATTTAGTNCAGLGLVGNYHCAASSTYQKTDGTGWLPIAMTGLAITPPISQLPIDPTNTTSTGQCYAYETNGTYWEIAASPESQKYISQTSTFFLTGSTRSMSPACAPITYTISIYAVGINPESIAFDSHTNTVWVGNDTDNIVIMFTPSR